MGFVRVFFLLLVGFLPVLSFAVTDSDHDGLDDAWESLNGRDSQRPDYFIYPFSDGFCAFSDAGFQCRQIKTFVGEMSRFSNLPSVSNPIKFRMAVNGSGCVELESGAQCFGGLEGYSLPSVSSATLIDFDVAASQACAIIQTDAKKIDCVGSYSALGVAPTLNDPTDIAIGETFACVIDSGEVKCWGDDVDIINNIPAVNEPSELQSGAGFVCVRDLEALQCWGANTSGETNAPAFNNLRSFSLGSNHGCGLDDDGVKCWGTLSATENMPTLTNPQAVWTGEFQSCVMDDYQIKCWGNNNNGVIDLLASELKLSGFANFWAGYGTTCGLNRTAIECWGTQSFSLNTISVDINRFIAIGEHHVCRYGLDGVACYGDNSLGQLDVPSTAFSVESVTAGQNHSCSYGFGGIACWGDNSDLQAPASLSYKRIQDASAGDKHTCLIYEKDNVWSYDNTLVCFGNNDYLQTAAPTTLDNPTRIASGAYHSCVLDNNGVSCWGKNTAGQTNVPTLFQVKDIGAGNNHSCALEPNNVVCWGDNTYGQADVPLLKHPTELIVGGNHTCVTDDTGLVCWGNEPSYRIGAGNGILIDPDSDGYNSQTQDDEFPLNSDDWADLDGDGIGDNNDADLDGDGRANASDNCPRINSSVLLDSDFDGKGNPCDDDDDGDGMPDYWEMQYGLNSLSASDKSLDKDNDGISNFDEYQFGLNPLYRDSDQDMLSDAGELLLGSDPLIANYLLRASGSITCYVDDYNGHCNGGGFVSVPLTDYADGFPALRMSSWQISGSSSGYVDRQDGQLKNSSFSLSSLLKPTVYASGDSFQCVIDLDRVVCSGFVDDVVIDDLNHPKEIAIANNRLCVIDTDGLHCFDASSNGLSPSIMMQSFVVSSPSHLSMGGDNVCVIDNAVVKCFSFYADSAVTLNIPSLQNPLDVQVGANHACAIDQTGLICWGDNSQGQISTPALVNVAAVATGNTHTCALSDEGLTCWGSNESGESDTMLTSVAKFDADRDGFYQSIDPMIKADALPYNASEWLDTDGDGLGNNADEDDDGDGVLDTVDNCPLYPNPAQVDTDGDNIGAGCDDDDDSDGMPDAWELSNQLNPGDKTDANFDNDADGLSNLEEYQNGTSPLYRDTDFDSLSDQWELDNARNPLVADYKISMGSGNVCILGDGRVECWGPSVGSRPITTDITDLAGMCLVDNGDIKCFASNVELTPPWGISDPDKLVVGDSHACSLKNGSVTCWRSGAITTDVPSTLMNVTDIFAGANSTCAIDASGLHCWGDAYQSSHPSGTFPQKVSIGTKASCMIDNGALQCWGSGAVVTSQKVLTNAVDVAVDVAVGRDVACAIENGNIQCWGSYSSVYGTDPLSPPATSNPVSLTANQDSFCVLDDSGVHCWGASGVDDFFEMREVSKIDAGIWSTCALISGEVKCWGSSSFLTNGSVNPYAIPTPSLAEPRAFSVGEENACAIDDTGLVCWGRTEKIVVPPVKLTNPLEVVVGTTSLGLPKYCVIDSNDVICWGDSQQTEIRAYIKPRQLHVSNDVVCLIDENGPHCFGGNNQYGRLDMPTLTNVQTLQPGYYHVCALSDEGVTCWGNNDFGQIDIPNTLSNPRWLSVGAGHNCVIDENGLTCWGFNDSGQTTVPEITDPLSVSAGGFHTCAIDQKGAICWGGEGSNSANIRPLTVNIDPDGDGYTSQDFVDAFPLDASEWLDTDDDGIGNNADTDDDGDGFDDTVDAFPLDVAEWLDTDGDGIGDNADLDDDNDGVVDALDEFPLNGAENADADGDGIGDNADLDDDNDTILDVVDNCPFVPNDSQRDTNADGIGNACEPLNASFEMSSVAGKVPLRLETDATASTGYIQSYKWSIGDRTQYGETAIFTMYEAGEYEVILTVKDVSGEELKTSQWLSVEPGDVIGDDHYTTLALSLTASSIKNGDDIDLSVKLTDPGYSEADLTGSSVLVSIVAPDGLITEMTTTTNAQGQATLSHIGSSGSVSFDQEGAWQISASFAGSTGYKAAQSQPELLLVGASAGYAVIVQGKITNEEGLLSHNKSTNRVYNTLIKRGFQDQNIFYFNWDTTQPGVDGLPYKSTILDAIGSLSDQMNQNPAPVYIVMVDHGGSSGEFYLDGSSVITPGELDAALDTLESSLSASALAKPRVAILGFCYSGNYISPLSAENRLIITSAASDEESYKGPEESDGIRSGEFFIDELFKELEKGETFSKAFYLSNKKTEAYTRAGVVNESNTLAKGYFDNAAQHPLIDDNGDGVGTNDLVLAGIDGNVAASLILGAGLNYDTNSAENPADVQRVSETVFLSNDINHAGLSMKANDNGQVGSAFIEVRSPSKTLAGSSTSTQQLSTNYDRRLMIPPGQDGNPYIDRFYIDYDGFTSVGKYEIFYYVVDVQTSNVSTAKSSVAYKNLSVNAAPADFDLVSPLNGSEEKTVVIFEWLASADPDLHGLSYTLEIADDASFNTFNGLSETYKVKGLQQTSVAIDGSAQLQDLSSYYWRVVAVDDFGAMTTSLQVGSFTTNNKNAPFGVVTGVVHNASYSGLQSASVQIDVGTVSVEVTADENGKFQALVPIGKATISSRMPGYTNQTIQQVPINVDSTINELRIGLDVDTNIEPVAVAGQDRSVDEGETISLDGLDSSDSDGTIVSYQWVQSSGEPIVTLVSDHASVATFVAPEVETTTELVFTLTVTDDDGASSKDDVIISVNNVVNDIDGDGVLDVVDNCPLVVNADQADVDGDGLGDACDPQDDTDGDADGVIDLLDNCPSVVNTDQTDIDGDGLGDACDPQNDTDTDKDGVIDIVDNCIYDANSNQNDLDNDGIGDACDAFDDTDTDVDGVADVLDNCPLIANGDQVDVDGDGIGDACDPQDDTDSDGDGIIDSQDNCPAVFNLSQLDTDGDGLGDACDDQNDIDSDGDGVIDLVDNCPRVANASQSDGDEDGLGDSCDPIDNTDTDSDGLRDEIELQLGTAIDRVDTDDDGISDFDEVQQGSDPLDINSPFRPSSVSVVELQDFNGDGIAEIAQFGVLNDGTDTPQLVILDPVTKATLSTYSWLADWSRPQLIKLADRDNDGIAELAVYGKRKDDGRMQLVVKSGARGASMGTWSWPNSWIAPRFVELKDMTGDGLNEYAIFGRYSANNVPQLVVRDGSSKAEIARYKFTPAWKNEIPLQWDDLTNDGIAEAAMFGEHRSNGKTFLYVVDGNSPDLKLSQYNWPNKWANPTFHLLPDLDGDGIREPAVFGVNLDDGRPQLQIKKGNTKKGVYAIYNWLATFSEVQFYQLGDQNGDGIKDFGVLAYNSANDKRQLMVKDGMDRTVTLANYFWPNNWDNARVVELDDLTGDGLPDLGLIGNNRITGDVQLQVKDRATRGLVSTYTWSASEANNVIVINVGDVDADGTPDVGVYSLENGQGTLEILSGKDSSVTIDVLMWSAIWH